LKIHESSIAVVDCVIPLESESAGCIERGSFEKLPRSLNRRPVSIKPELTSC